MNSLQNVLRFAACAFSPRGIFVAANLLLLPATTLATERQTCPEAAPDPLPYAAAALPLREAVEEQEIWGCLGGTLIVRNVVNPSLTPILPATDKATGAAVIVAPGGGFAMLSMTSEGFAVAEWLAENGIAAFVLKYRLNPTPVDFEEWTAEQGKKMSELRRKGEEPPRLPTPEDAVADAAAAVRMVRENAAQWGVDAQRVGMLGFSAGAMTTLEAGDLKDAKARPSFIAPVYPPMWSREIPAHAPPMFLAISLDDPLFTANARPLELVADWHASGRPFEAHLYQSGGHGFGMKGNGAASALWAQEFYAWMKDRSLLVSGVSYSVASTPIAKMLEDPEALAVLNQFLPGIADDTRIKLAGSLSLETLAGFAPQMIDEEKLGQIQQALDAL